LGPTGIDSTKSGLPGDAITPTCVPRCCLNRFGTEESEVQILSPRRISTNEAG
jgi:hypothetical protein